ncbi:MAG: hypothetical protein AAB471_00140 [Patescibacteria group bacterium]
MGNPLENSFLVQGEGMEGVGTPKEKTINIEEEIDEAMHRLQGLLDEAVTTLEMVFENKFIDEGDKERLYVILDKAATEANDLMKDKKRDGNEILELLAEISERVDINTGIKNQFKDGSEKIETFLAGEKKRKEGKN